MALKDKVTYHVSRDFLNWWKTTVIGNDRDVRMLLAWWGWEACRKYYGPGPMEIKATARETRKALRERGGNYNGKQEKATEKGKEGSEET